MKNLNVYNVNIKKLERTSLQKRFSNDYYDIKGLNKLSKRIERGLNKQIRKNLRKGKKLEDLGTVVTTVKDYAFRITDDSIREQFYRNLESENIKITQKYLDDMRLIPVILNCFSKSICATQMCEVELDIKKTLQKKL